MLALRFRLMRQRLISAAVLVPVVVILFVLGDVWLPLGIAVLSAFVAYEAAQLFRRAGFPASTWLAAGWTPLAVLGMAESAEPSFELQFALVGPGIAVLVIAAAVLAIAQPDPAVGLRVWIGTVIASLYAGLLGFAAVFVGLGPDVPDGVLFGYPLNNGKIWLLILVASVWTLDSAAYVVGRSFPRGHFMNHISPHKTWSGAIGGTIAAVLACTLLVVGAGMSPLGGVVLGGLIAVAAQLGDLTESILKRAAGVKDSGTLIPGHGGFLDRVDSFLFAAPTAFLAVIVLGLVGIL